MAIHLEGRIEGVRVDFDERETNRVVALVGWLREMVPASARSAHYWELAGLPADQIPPFGDVGGAAHAALEALGPEPEDPAFPGATMKEMRRFRILSAARACLSLRPAIEGGDGAAVLEALAYCIAHRLEVPGWLAAHFMERYEAAIAGHAKGWADVKAFGRAIPKGTNAAGVRASRIGYFAYMHAIEQIKADPSATLGEGFWQDVGERIDYGATRAEEIARKFFQEETCWPPLSVIRTGLQEGKEVHAIIAAWQGEQQRLSLKDQGFSDSVIEEIMSIGAPENPKDSGVT